MKILLVEPDDRSVPGLNFGGLFTMEPMSLELLAAAVPEYDVKIVDLRLDPLPIEHYLRSFKPDVVGVTGITAVHYEMRHVLKEAKATGAFTVAGGPHASFAYKSLNADAVVIGEGEGAFRDLVLALDSGGDLSSVPNLAWYNGQKWARNRRRTYNLWPLPRRCFIKDYRYTAFGLDVAMVESTRGCPHRCRFCVTPKLFRGRYRVRDVEEVVAYLATRPEPFIMFPDADFMASAKYVSRLLDSIRHSKLKKKYSVAIRADEVMANPDLIENWSKEGLCFAFIGFEGYKQSQQNNYQKDSRIEFNSGAVSLFHRCGIISIGTLIVDPDWGEKEFNECLTYAKKLGSDITLFSVLTPFPGTSIKKEYKAIASYDKFDVLHAVTKTRLSYGEFQHNFIRISKAVFLSKASIRLFWKLFRRKLLRVNSLALLGEIKEYIATIETRIKEER